ncbi:MAG TPA: glycosyltransferase family 39 protein, partial [Vicinamibacterales bacterium]
MTVWTRTTASRASWIGPALAWSGGLAALVLWLGSTNVERLRAQLTVLQFWSLSATVLFLLLLAIHIIGSERAVWSRRDVRPLAGIVALGVCLTLFIAPRTHRIFYDEQIYESIGQNLAELRRAQVCNDGRIEYAQLQCSSGEYNKQPYGYPYLLSLAYRVFGVRDGVAFGVNAAAMAAAIGAVYFLTLLLFADRQAAAFSALVLALMPQQIVWSATAAAEPSASAAAAVGAASAAYYLRRGSPAALAAMGAIAAYAIQFRPESILILPVMAWIAWPRLWPELQRPRGWWAAALFLCLAAVPIAHLFAVRHAGWGTNAARFGAPYVVPNLRVNGRFFLMDWRFPMLFTVFAIGGATARRSGFERGALVVYFLLFFAVDLAFYAGSYNYGADVRYSLMTYPPLAVLAGVGIVRLIRAADRV